jgi:hypothetical protein
VRGLVVIFPVHLSAWFFLGAWFLYQLIEANSVTRSCLSGSFAAEVPPAPVIAVRGDEFSLPGPS